MLNKSLTSDNYDFHYSEPNNYIPGQLLSPFQRKLLEKKLETNLRPEYRRRIEIMLLADGGQSQTQICAALNCSHETARYWMYIAQTGQAHKWKDLPIGRPKTVNEQYLNRLQDLVNRSPHEFGYAFGRWTAQWLSKHLAKELGIEVSDRHVNRLLKQMGLSTRETRGTKTERSENLKNSNIVFRDLNPQKEPQSLKFSPFHLT
jgi:putative transposase